MSSISSNCQTLGLQLRPIQFDLWFYLISIDWYNKGKLMTNDAVQPTAAQHDKDGRSVVCVVSSAGIRSRMNQWGWARTFRSVRNLGTHLNSDLSMNTHITRTVSCCFAVLRQFAASVDSSVNPSCSRSSCHWSFHGWTMVVRRWPTLLHVG